MRWLSLLAIISLLCYINQPLMAAEDGGKTPKAPIEAGGGDGGDAVEEIRSGLKSDIRLIFFAGLGGGIVGLSTLSFVDKPSRELKRISIGFAVGAIIASVVVLYKKTSTSMTGGGITNLGVMPSAVTPVPYQDPYYEGEEEENEEEESEEYDEDFYGSENLFYLASLSRSGLQFGFPLFNLVVNRDRGFSIKANIINVVF